MDKVVKILCLVMSVMIRLLLLLMMIMIVFFNDAFRITEILSKLK